VLDADDVGLGPSGEHGSDHPSSVQSLLDVKIGGGFVEHVNIGLLHAGQRNDESLELSSGQLANLSLQDCLQIEHLDNVVEEASFVDGSESSSDNNSGSLGLGD